MFENCDRLTTAPDLPALELVETCYHKMFYSCNRLKYVKALFLTTPGVDYTSQWLYLVDDFGIFTKNKDATWNTTGDEGVPNTWTVEYE